MKLNKDTVIKILDSIYDNALIGIPGTKSIEDFAQEYLKDAGNNPEIAIDHLIKWQITKNVTNGFLSNVGGAIALPITLPIELTSSFYIQLRTIAAIAYLSGFDPRSDKVKTLCYACLTGKACKDILSKVSIEIGTKLTTQMISAISGSTLVAINQMVGFRLITKFGEKGVINLGKMIPLVGGVLGGAFEGGFTYMSASYAKKFFLPLENSPPIKKAS